MCLLRCMICSLFCLIASPVLAQGPGQYSQVSLTGVGRIAETDGLWAMVDIQVAPGWKTYWRNPGDAGIPPRFDWTGSINLKAAHISWPAPKRFHDGYAYSIGYGEPGVVLPIRIEPENPDRPVSLSLQLDYAVCERICIPERAELSGFVRAHPADSPQEQSLTTALATVPVDALDDDLPAIADISLANDGTHIDVTLEHAETLAELDMFAEGPNGEHLLVPTRLEPADPVSFAVSLKGAAKSGADGRRPYRFTIVWDGGAVERYMAIR